LVTILINLQPALRKGQQFDKLQWLIYYQQSTTVCW